MNEAFEMILERLAKLQQEQNQELCEHKNFTSEMQSIRGHNILQNVKKIVQKIAEDYNNGWIPCSAVDHPEHCHECEVTMLDSHGYTREIAFFADTWRRASDEAAIIVVAWKKPSEPYHPEVNLSVHKSL